MPRGKAKTVTVEFTLRDVQFLRALIIKEAQRNNYDSYQRASELPPRLKRLSTVAQKIWVARQAFEQNAS